MRSICYDFWLLDDADDHSIAALRNLPKSDASAAAAASVLGSKNGLSAGVKQF